MRHSLRKRMVLAVAVLLPLAWATAAHAQCSQSTPLIAGQHIDSGLVTVNNDGSNLTITYETFAPWVMTEIHAAVADSVAGLPHNKKGNPVPGQFPYSATFNPGVSSYTVTIPLTGFDVGDTIYIAAHAAVSSPGSGGSSGNQQTGWGYGPRFPGASNWATYFTYFICGGGE